MNRIQTLRAGSANTAMVSDAIRAAAADPTIVMVRLQLLYTRGDRPYRHVQAYDAQFRPVGLDRDAIAAIDVLIRSRHPGIDWVFDHDWHLDTGMLRRSPGVTEPGYIPPDHKRFGGSNPVFLIDAAGTTNPAAPDTPRSAA